MTNYDSLFNKRSSLIYIYATANRSYFWQEFLEKYLNKHFFDEKGGKSFKIYSSSSVNTSIENPEATERIRFEIVP